MATKNDERDEKPVGKGRKALRATGKAARVTGKAALVTGKAAKTTWNYCLPWPLGCGHSVKKQGCKCCKKHV